MHDDGLFAHLGPPRSASSEPPPPPPSDALADWQVAQLREALAGAGTHTMDGRQSLVEELVGRPVASLRGLTVSEARMLLEALTARKRAAGSTGTSWDNREEDTWIDRL